MTGSVPRRAEAAGRSGPARRIVARVLAFAVPALAALAAVAQAARAEGVPADTLAGRVVRRIDIDAQEIFDPVPPGRLHAFYAISNVLHVRTRAATVRAALVFRPGDPWRPDDGDESERKLREFDFLLPDSVIAVPVPGSPDSVDVQVTTHDNWTTSPEVTLEGGGDKLYGTIGLTERNLAGLGLALSAMHKEDPVGTSRFLSVSDASIAGSHWRAQFVAGSGDAGKVNSVDLRLPFWADHAPTAMGGSWKRNISLAHLFQQGVDVAQVPLDEEDAEVWWGAGRQAPDGRVRRFVGRFRAFDHHLGESQLEPGAPPEFGGGEEEVRIRRVEGEFTHWRQHFVVRRGVDYMDRVEDYDLGFLAVGGAGLALTALGSGANEGWLLGRTGAGVDAGRGGFGLASAEVSSRLRSGPREILTKLRARWIYQPHPSRTLVVAILGEAGRRMPRDYQLSAGALSGLRGFHSNEVNGTQLYRGNAEFRWTATRNLLQLVTLGGAAFWDSARAYGPGSAGEGWHHGAGFGLRISLPRSAINAVARFDVAWPLAPHVDGRRGPTYSFGSGQAF